MSRALTPRELQIARLVANEALTNNEIADRLGISPRTVHAYMNRIRDSLNIERKRHIRQALIQQRLL